MTAVAQAAPEMEKNMTPNDATTATPETALTAVVSGVDLTPQPIPDYADVLADVSRVVAFLSTLVDAADDDRSTAAARLLRREDPAGEMRIARVARAAYDYAYQLGTGAGAEIEDFAADMVAVIYDLSERGAETGFPLRFDAPGPFAVVLETADARRRLEGWRGATFSSRQLARLVRSDEATVEALLEAEGQGAHPYGVSLRELAEMDQGDCTYWHGQDWVFGLEDVPGWLARWPGHVPMVGGAVRPAA